MQWRFGTLIFTIFALALAAFSLCLDILWPLSLMFQPIASNVPKEPKVRNAAAGKQLQKLCNLLVQNQNTKHTLEEKSKVDTTSNYLVQSVSRLVCLVHWKMTLFVVVCCFTPYIPLWNSACHCRIMSDWCCFKWKSRLIDGTFPLSRESSRGFSVQINFYGINSHRIPSVSRVMVT